MDGKISDHIRMILEDEEYLATEKKLDIEETDNDYNFIKDRYFFIEQKFKDHVVYARVIQGVDELEKNYKIMDLSNPMIGENDKKYLDEVVKTKDLNYIPDQFIAMYNEDKLGGMIRNLDYWLKENFEKLVI